MFQEWYFNLKMVWNLDQRYQKNIYRFDYFQYALKSKN